MADALAARTARQRGHGGQELIHRGRDLSAQQLIEQRMSIRPNWDPSSPLLEKVRLQKKDVFVTACRKLFALSRLSRCEREPAG
jgi:hypothetical protein